jgi:hypothetical protein
MSSARRIAANRSNGRKSRGPRTAAGKSRASVNSFRHGLAAITRHNPAFSSDIAGIAEAICADGKDALLLEQALTIAANEIVLIRLRAERVAAIERRHDITRAGDLREEVNAMRHAISDLESLARHERRAWSGRNRAIRRFMEIKARSGEP